MHEPDARPVAEAVHRFLTFQIDGDLFALPADDVREVIRLPALTRVPQTPASLMGLANLRGLVLPIASFRGLLGREAVAEPALSEGGATRVLVLDGAPAVGVVVDRVEALIRVVAGQIEADDGGEDSFGFRSAESGAIVRIVDIRPLLQEALPVSRRMAAAVPHMRPVARTVARATDDQRALVLLGFDVAGQEFALPLDRVQEIVPFPDGVALVPHADSIVLGMADLRDTLMPLVSARAMLGLTEGAGEHRDVIVVPVAGALVGFVVDRARAILRVDPERIDTLPSVLRRSDREAEIQLICRLDEGRRLVSVLSPDHLFREETMRRLKADQAAARPGGKPERDHAAPEEAFVVFQLDGADYGLPIGAVDEVTRVPDEVGRVPKAPAFLEGVMNLRGTVVPLVDQRRRMGLPAGLADERQRVIVMSLGGSRTGFIVDSVSRILKVPAAAIGPAPELSDVQVHIIKRVVNLAEEGRIVLLLDPAALLQPDVGIPDSDGVARHGPS